MQLTICAWHDAKQFLLPGMVATHGICPVCNWKFFADHMKHPAPEWPRIINEMGWQHLPNGSYWGRLVLDMPDGRHGEIVHVEDGCAFRLFVDGNLQLEGDLTDCLEAFT